MNYIEELFARQGALLRAVSRTGSRRSGRTRLGALLMAATDIRPKITLACQECKNRNYITRKNRRNDPDRLELKKYCPKDKRHTVHRETR